MLLVSEHSTRTEQIDEDAAWVLKAQRGDLDAFESIVEKYKKKVFNLAFKMLQDREDASDAAQDAFLKVYRSLPRFKGDAKFSTWLYRIVTNVCLDYIRRRKKVVEISLDKQLEMSDGKLDFELPDEAINIEEEAEKTEFHQLVLDAVDNLPETHRLVILMRDFQNMSYSEIAELLSCPEGTVKSRINRARRFLRGDLLKSKQLHDYLDNEPSIR